MATAPHPRSQPRSHPRPHPGLSARTLVRRLGASAVLAAGAVALVAPVSAVADDGTGTGSSGTASSSTGARLEFAATAPVTGVKPGDSFSSTFAVKNTGDAPATNVAMTFNATQGLEFAGKKFSNCVYDAIPAQDEGPAEATATCDIDETLAPGTVYVPSAPLPFTVTPIGLYERFGATIQADSETFPPGTTAGGGADPVLHLVPQAAGSGDGVTYDQGFANGNVTVDSTADFALTGARLTGKAGDTVTADLTFANKGPGWVTNDVSQPVTTFEVTIPRGTTLTKPVDYCTADGRAGGGAGGAAKYRCVAPLNWIGQHASVSYPFKLRIDRVVPDATGTLSFVKGETRAGTREFDHDATDDTARIVLNGTGTSGGSDSGTGTAGSAGGTGTQLAATGAGDTLLFGGLTAAALAVGGALAVTAASRRR